MLQLTLLAVLVFQALRPSVQEAAAALAAGKPNGPIVALDSGRIEGLRLPERGLCVFRGIPYAAPPVGELRWRPPQPAPAWEGVRPTKEFGPACPQSPLIAYLSRETLPPTSEDCLTLNVWTPAEGERTEHEHVHEHEDEPLPVLVWIHGGGFVGGWAYQQSYDGAAFAARGLVFVSIQYRLGPLGYLALPELAEDPEASANHGLLDQIAALRWIQRNIAAFGGDPRRVTVMGESAGASSVLALCAAPPAQGLFHGAIAQSTWLTETLFVPLATARADARGLSELLVREPGAASLAALRALPADTLWERLGERFQPILVLDGATLPLHPEEAFATGVQHDVPLLAGTTADEGTVFVSLFPWRTVEALEAGLEREFGPAFGDLLALDPVVSDADVPARVARLVTDRWFVRGTRRMLRGMSRSWQYLFTRTDPELPALGARHAVELPYVFGTLPANAPGADRELSARLLDYWVQFAKTGDPNAAGLPTWPAFGSEQEPYLILGEPLAQGAQLRKETCDVLDELRAGPRAVPGR